MLMAFVKIGDILEAAYKDRKVAVRGWVYRKHEGKELIFLLHATQLASFSAR